MLILLSPGMATDGSRTAGQALLPLTLPDEPVAVVRLEADRDLVAGGPTRRSRVERVNAATPGQARVNLTSASARWPSVAVSTCTRPASCSRARPSCSTA